MLRIDHFAADTGILREEWDAEDKCGEKEEKAACISHGGSVRGW
jgi:hypothetical protein